MMRKLTTVGFLLAFLLVGFGPRPAHATNWAWSGDGPSATVWDWDTNAPYMEYGIGPVPGYSEPQDWYLFNYADATGPIILSYEFSGDHSEYCAEAWLHAYVTHNGITTWTELVNTGPWGTFYGFSYSGSVQLAVEAGDVYGFKFGGSNCEDEPYYDYMYGSLYITTGGIYQPTPQYTMWLLTKNDGSYCILKSPTHPSVESQNRLCLPEKYDNSWTADNVACVGTVDENGFWTCAQDFINWQELGK